MALAPSKVTAQAQISVPPEVRRKPGVGPAVTFTSEDIHRAIFPAGKPEVRSVEEMDEGLARHLREKHEV